MAADMAAEMMGWWSYNQFVNIDGAGGPAAMGLRNV